MRELFIIFGGMFAAVLAAPWLVRLVDAIEPYLHRYFEWVQR